ncbi:MAG: CsbD family protein [Acidobacteriota bacterium]
MWNKDEVKGAVENVKGKAKEAVGDLTDDEQLKEEGQDQQAVGNVQQQLGKARRKVGEVIEDVGKAVKR